MKVVIVKSYEKSHTVYSNYGDDSEEVWHNLNAVECVREMSPEDAEVLRRAVNHFNSKGHSAYKLKYLEVMEDHEVDVLLSNFREYETREAQRVEKAEHDRKQKEIAAKAKSEANKHARVVKKFAKQLNLSEDEVRLMLAKK